ncbi:MAG: SPFH/Band 7/PHB domain protein [Pedosphaera sp.]|nr:SPFH/Band 7/PHB domain protein [Pedosphaera sp.]
MTFVIGVPLLMLLIQFVGIFITIPERTAKVFMLFGKVLAVYDEPGLHFLPVKLGWRAFIVRWFGQVQVVDLRLDQEYLRSLPVNSEEGAPMGIGVWYEMMISDPVAFLFKNADPRGSLSANVSNAAVRCLSNLPLDQMMSDRHTMSMSVRNDVSPKSQEWGYRLGSVYVRKVHFRDVGMIKGIEEKVVNRLRQVTSAIRQDGANQVSIISSTAERQAAIEFAKAQAMRPRIVGEVLKDIAQDPEISRAMFQVLETQNILESKADIVIIPRGNEITSAILAAEESAPPTPPLIKA